MTLQRRLEMRRLSDDVVYTFTRSVRTDGSVGYRRDDIELWMLYRPEHGWVIVEEASGEITGRPWSTAVEDQRVSSPPAGEWVSKKGVKSYVYRLSFLSD
jgi:hypothetical protein